MKEIICEVCETAIKDGYIKTMTGKAHRRCYLKASKFKITKMLKKKNHENV